MDTCVHIYLLVVVSATAVGVARFRLLTLPARLLVVLLLLSGCEEILAHLLAHLGQYNMPVYHFYVIIEFWMYSLIYFYLLKKGKARFVALFLPVFFTAFAIVITTTYQQLPNFPSVNISVSNVFLVCYSLYALKYLIDSNPFQPLLKSSFFWLNTAVLVYFTLQLFIWGLISYMMRTDKDISPLVDFGLFISMGYYLMLGFVVWLDNRKPVN